MFPERTLEPFSFDGIALLSWFHDPLAPEFLRVSFWWSKNAFDLY